MAHKNGAAGLPAILPVGPEDRNLDLLVPPCGSRPQDVLGEFYRSGFHSTREDLISSYRQELEQGDHTFLD